MKESGCYLYLLHLSCFQQESNKINHLMLMVEKCKNTRKELMMSLLVPGKSGTDLPGQFRESSSPKEGCIF